MLLRRLGDSNLKIAVVVVVVGACTVVVVADTIADIAVEAEVVVEVHTAAAQAPELAMPGVVVA